MVVELIAKTINGKFQFEGNCKLIIDSLSKLLLVEPFNEEFKMISALFKWKFVAQKNILFVLAENDFEDFALVFDNPKKCSKIYRILVKKGATVGMKNLIRERFLPSFCVEISANNESNLKLKEIFFKWIQLQDGKEKEEYIQILKDFNVYDLVYSNAGEKKQLSNPLKRKTKNLTDEFQDKKLKSNADENMYLKTDISKRASYEKEETHLNKTHLIETPDFEILKYIQNSASKSKLFTFDTSERKYCYEYFWCKTKNYFYCNGCVKNNKSTTAKIIKSNGSDVIRLNRLQHACNLKEYNGIIEKQNFEVITYENHKNSVVKRLTVFLDSVREICYEYMLVKTMYQCCGCAVKRHFTGANICQKEDGTEFVMLKSNDHVCEPRKYNPEKFVEKEIVEAKNFKIFEFIQNGFEISKLIIFTSQEHKTCYEYSWMKSQKYFRCCGCKKSGETIIAKVFEHRDGRKYIKLSRKQHICEPRKYDAGKFDVTNKSEDNQNFKIFKYKRNGTITTKLIVFCETNMNLCYEYWWNKMAQSYWCSYCPMKRCVTATVRRKNDTKETLKLCNVQHICDLQEFDPIKYHDDVIVDKEMYKIISTTLRQTRENILIIFLNEEKKAYYRFNYYKKKKYYHCYQCRSSKLYITATIENEGKENESVFVSSQKHICEPLEYSTLTNGYIITAQNYQLFNRRTNAKIHQHLAIFTNDDKSECFDYTWQEKIKRFVCYKCQEHHKIHIYAKILKNYANEEYVELSENLHKCKPIKFVPENYNLKIFKASNFKLFETVYHGRNIKKLAISDSKDKNMGYIYSYHQHNKYYVCSRCSIKKKNVTARILQDENGQSYVELHKNEHVCDLQEICDLK